MHTHAEFVLTYDAALGDDAPASSPKHLRTVEFVLGSGAGTGSAQTGVDAITGALRRASDVNVYAGSAWNSTKGTAGTKTIRIPNTGIRVVSAYLDVKADIATAVSTTDIELALDVNPGPQAGIDVEVSSMVRSGNIYDQSGLSSPILTAKADVTSFFQTQTDNEWNTGIAVVGMLSVFGPTWSGGTMKLIITYEQDYSTAAHTELKTVRFPLDSTATGDVGSRATSCGVGATCSFKYQMDLPDLATTSDIVDSWFEIAYVDDGAATTSVSVRGSGATSTYGVPGEALTDGMERYFLYRPLSSHYSTSTSYLDVSPTTAISALGGELVVTYRYSTGETTQVETIRYLSQQQSAPPGTATSTATTFAPTISNTGRAPMYVWQRVHAPIAQSLTVTLSTSIGNSASTTRGYQVTLANPRGGSVRLYHDAGAATTSWSGASTTVNFTSAQSSATGDAPLGVETFVTFKWSGATGGTVTKSVSYFAGQSGTAPATANINDALPFIVDIPETVTKTYRSAYILASVSHTNAGTITGGTVKVSLTQSGMTTFTEAADDTENYRAIYLEQATSTNFAQDTTISWNERAFALVVQGNQANEMHTHAEFVLTYDAALDGSAIFDTLKYRWRMDDGPETSATYPISENTPLVSGIFIGDRLRLRTLIQNYSTTATSGIQFRLEHSSSSCSVWQIVPSSPSTEHWATDLTTYILNGASTTNSGGISDPAGLVFTAGYAMTNGNTTGQQSMGSNQFTEMEWTIRSTPAVTLGTTYCFRVTNLGSTFKFIYSVIPQISVTSTNARPVSGGSTTEDVGSGPQITGGGQGGGTGFEGSGSGGGQTGGGQGGGGNAE
jgi:hypothetical protein